MYAQISEGGTTPERRTEMDRIVTRELIPALETEPGYTAAMSLAQAASGNGLTIVVWKTEAQANRSLSEYGPACLKALAKIDAISTGNRRPITVWKINPDDRNIFSSALTLLASIVIPKRWLEMWRNRRTRRRN